MSAISLREAFESVPDPREASGRRYPLPVVLAFAATAMMAGARSLYAIAQFGRDRGGRFAKAMGFTRGRTPCCTTLHYLFRRLDAGAFEAAIRRWSQGPRAGRGRPIAIDGKTLRGTTGVQLPGVHLLAAYAHQAGRVLGQVRVNAKTNEHKTALELLGSIPVRDQVITGDAMFCQKELCREVRRRGGDYLWLVKDNQPTLKADIALAFENAVSPSGATCCRWGTTTGDLQQQRPRSCGTAVFDLLDGVDRLSRLAGGGPSFPCATRTKMRRQDQPRRRLWLDQSLAGARRCGQAAGTGPGSLGHREPTALRAGCDLWRGRVSGSSRVSPANPGEHAQHDHRLAQCCRVPQ